MNYIPAPANYPDNDAVAPYAATNVRVLTGKVARALFGPAYDPSAAGGLNPDQLKDLTADTIAKIIFYTNGLWPYRLVVDDIDANGMAAEYSVSPRALAIEDETFVTVQAALDWFFFEFKDKKVSEEISDEGEKWVYALSANLLLAQYKQLVAERDRALEILEQRAGYLTDYVSFIAERDALTGAMVEWWVRAGLTYPSGQEIFPSVAAFGG